MNCDLENGNRRSPATDGGEEKGRERESERERDQEQWSGRRETRVGEGGSLQERIAADSQGCGIGRGPLSSAPATYIYTRQRRFFEILFSSSSLDG